MSEQFIAEVTSYRIDARLILALIAIVLLSAALNRAVSRRSRSQELEMVADET